MRSHLVVIAPPGGNHGSCVFEVAEVVIIEALIAKLAIETLDVGVLRRFASSDQLEIDAAAIGPTIQRPAGEFRPLVGTNRPRSAAKLADGAAFWKPTAN